MPMDAPGRSRAMNRAFLLLALVILAALSAVSGIACEQVHYDMYRGTDAGAGFEAPASEAGSDAPEVDGGADAD
jgi:hypothetical protein